MFWGNGDTLWIHFKMAMDKAKGKRKKLKVYLIEKKHLIKKWTIRKKKMATPGAER